MSREASFRIDSWTTVQYHGRSRTVSLKDEWISQSPIGAREERSVDGEARDSTGHESRVTRV